MVHTLFAFGYGSNYSSLNNVYLITHKFCFADNILKNDTVLIKNIYDTFTIQYYDIQKLRQYQKQYCGITMQPVYYLTLLLIIKIHKYVHVCVEDAVF